MKKLFSISDSLSNKISFWHLVLFLLLLPVDRYLSQLTLISFTGHVLIHSNRAGWKRLFTADNLILALLWFSGLLSTLFTAGRNAGWKESMIQLGLILFPFVLSLTNISLTRYRDQLLQIFAWGCVGAVIYLYADAGLILVYYRLPVSDLFTQAFFNQNFSSPLGIHATYLALLLALACAVFIKSLVEAGTTRQQWINAVALAVLSAGLLQLGSRAVLIATGVFLLLPLPLFLVRGRQRLYSFLIAGVLMAGGYWLISKNHVLHTRYIADFREDLRNRTDLSSRTPEPRLVRWEAAMELIRQSPWTGYGTIRAEKELQDKYYSKQLYISWLLHLNTHNQYLSQWLRLGIGGLLLYLFLLLWALRLAWIRRDFIFACFLISICIVSFSENILEVNKGVFFCGFFLAFFLKSGKPGGKRLRSDKNAELV